MLAHCHELLCRLGDRVSADTRVNAKVNVERTEKTRCGAG